MKSGIAQLQVQAQLGVYHYLVSVQLTPPNSDIFYLLVRAAPTDKTPQFPLCVGIVLHRQVYYKTTDHGDFCPTYSYSADTI